MGVVIFMLISLGVISSVVLAVFYIFCCINSDQNMKELEVMLQKGTE